MTLLYESAPKRGKYMYRLTYHRTDTGNARIYFREPQLKQLFCFQEGLNGFDFFLCSNDGEPQAPKNRQDIDHIDAPKGGTSLDMALINFMLDSKQVYA